MHLGNPSFNNYYQWRSSWARNMIRFMFIWTISPDEEIFELQDKKYFKVILDYSGLLSKETAGTVSNRVIFWCLMSG